MIGENSMMAWIQLVGLGGILAFRVIENAREKIKNTQEKLLNQQSSREKELMTVFQKVSSIDDLIKAENQKNRRIQANDRTAYDAVLNLQTYLANTQENREVQLAKTVELKMTIEKLEEEKGALQAELNQAKSRNLKLSRENVKLKAGNNSNCDETQYCDHRPK